MRRQGRRQPPRPSPCRHSCLPLCCCPLPADLSPPAIHASPAACKPHAITRPSQGSAGGQPSSAGPRQLQRLPLPCLLCPWPRQLAFVSLQPAGACSGPRQGPSRPQRTRRVPRAPPRRAELALRLGGRRRGAATAAGRQAPGSASSWQHGAASLLQGDEAAAGGGADAGAAVAHGLVAARGRGVGGAGTRAGEAAAAAAGGHSRCKLWVSAEPAPAAGRTRERAREASASTRAHGRRAQAPPLTGGGRKHCHSRDGELRQVVADHVGLDLHLQRRSPMIRVVR